MSTSIMLVVMKLSVIKQLSINTPTHRNINVKQDFLNSKTNKKTEENQTMLRGLCGLLNYGRVELMV